MSRGLISVIIPVYNTDKYLKTCINSVLCQKDIELEILLIDDGSTDHSVEICQEYADEYENVRFFRREHTGVSAARNFGITVANGEYIYFLDSDDYILDGVLKILFNKIDHVDLALGNYKYQYGSKIEESIPIYVEGIVKPIDVIHFTCAMATKLYRTEIIRKFNIVFPPLKLGEDLCFFHQYLSVISTIAVVKNPIFVYRMYEGSSSKTYGLKALDYLTAFHIIEKNYCNQESMKKEFAYDEMFYLKGNLRKLPRYKNKKERVIIFEKYQLMARRIAKGSDAAEKMRHWILHAPKYIYCGTIPTFIYQKLRNMKHVLYRRKNG